MQLCRLACRSIPAASGAHRSAHWRSRSRRLGVSDDIKLFVSTFVAGFLFVSILISWH